MRDMDKMDDIIHRIEDACFELSDHLKKNPEDIFSFRSRVTLVHHANPNLPDNMRRDVEKGTMYLERAYLFEGRRVKGGDKDLDGNFENLVTGPPVLCVLSVNPDYWRTHESSGDVPEDPARGLGPYALEQLKDRKWDSVAGPFSTVELAELTAGSFPGHDDKFYRVVDTVTGEVVSSIGTLD
jgi:hypothetical protein